MNDQIDIAGRVMSAAEPVSMPADLNLPHYSDDDPGYDETQYYRVSQGSGVEPPQDDGSPLPPAARCIDYPLNDYGNGQRLIEHFGDDLVWISRVGWFVWNGKVWAADPDGIAVRRLSHRMTDLISAEAFLLPISDDDAAILRQVEDTIEEMADLIARIDRDDAQEKRYKFLAALRRNAAEIQAKRDKAIGRRLTHAKNAGNSNAIKNLMSEGGAIIARSLEDMDASALMVNVDNCVLQLSSAPATSADPQSPAPHVWTCTPLDHARDHYLSKIMPVAYDPQASCPQFMAFLDRVMPSGEMQRFLQRWFGYSMTGLTNEQKFTFFYGSGANGKSVLVDLIAKIMGDYGASAKIESITGRGRRGGGDATPDLVPLIGARFVRTSEPDEGQRLQEGLIKELTGGEPILVRALNENFVLIYPIFKLTISGNHKPEIHGGDDGIWRRVMLVPFEIQIPAHERDPDLGKKLWAERSGVLNWLIAGLLDYLRNGLQVPAQVTEATQEYREDSDPIATFLELCCNVTGSADDRVTAKEMTAAFNYWLEDSGRGSWSPNTVAKRLKTKCERWKSPSTGFSFRQRKQSSMIYEGVRLSYEFRERFDLRDPRATPPAQYVPEAEDFR